MCMEVDGCSRLPLDFIVEERPTCHLQIRRQTRKYIWMYWSRKDGYILFTNICICFFFFLFIQRVLKDLKMLVTRALNIFA